MCGRAHPGPGSARILSPVAFGSGSSRLAGLSTVNGRLDCCFLFICIKFIRWSQSFLGPSEASWRGYSHREMWLLEGRRVSLGGRHVPQTWIIPFGLCGCKSIFLQYISLGESDGLRSRIPSPLSDTVKITYYSLVLTWAVTTYCFSISVRLFPLRAILTSPSGT